MKTSRISSGSTFETVAGYSRAIVVEHHGYAEVLISGVTGFNYDTMTIAPDAPAQTRQCFANIAKVLAQAGGGLEHVVRVRYLLTDPGQFEALAPIFGEHLGASKPAATALVCGLVDPRMALEIEIDARIPR
ncbi:MAG TPA: RidA family protein [Caulobacteraceae bacterium]|nr:RidA family protein [Caulobacteraceae bacterium]